MEDFNKYTSHINYSPIVDFVLQQGKQTYYKKGEYFSRQGYTFDHSFVGNYPAFQLQDKSNVDIQALCDCSVYVINYQQMTEFYNTNDAHQKLGRRIAETLLWEVYDRMISMYSLTPEERYLEIINRCPDLLKLITLKELASYLLIRPETLSRIRRKVVQK